MDDITRHTIFIVDDNPTNLMAGQNALEEHYDVLTLNSGERLLKALEKRKPSLILLDVDMPDMDGYDIIQRLKKNPDFSDIPVIFLTGKNDAESELEGLTLGAVDYITKPFSQPKLLKRIEVHLLVETQKKKLLDFNHNLQDMIASKMRSVTQLQRAILKTMAGLVEYRDDITGGHIERTTRYLEILLDAVAAHPVHRHKVAAWDRDLILQSAQLHDVGKIAIKDNILQKPGKLTPEEFDEIKKHTSFGEEVIEKIKTNTVEKNFLEHAALFAGTHHEKWDGSGYHRGLKGDEIPFEGRMMAIADVYDALVSDRPYKKAFTHEEAVKIIVEGKGSHFDPDLVDVFLQVADQFDKVNDETRAAISGGGGGISGQGTDKR